MSPQKDNVEVLTPGICEHDLTWKWGLFRCNEVKMELYQIQVGPKSNNWYPYKERELETQTHTQGRRACKDGGKNWRYAVTSQKTPRTAGNQQKLGRGKEGLFPGAFRRSLDF